MGKVFKGLVKFTVAAAAVGGLCYAFKDQIKESKVYKEHDMDEKINKVKSTIKEKMPAVFDNEEDYIEEDDLLLDDIDITAESPERDYVSIEPEATTATEADETDSSDTESAAQAEEEVPTIEL